MSHRHLSAARRTGVATLSITSLLAGVISSVGMAPSTASTRPNFQMPFPCGETWNASTYSGHLAIDWNLPTQDLGKPVVAAASGTASTWVDSNGANGVTINHGGGWSTQYGHLQSTGVSGSVKAGQFIGRVGNTGMSSGPHLHFAQLLNGQRQSTLYANGTALRPGTIANPTAYTSKNCTTPPADPFLNSALQPVTGDWDGNGKTDIGLRRVSTGKFYLRTGPTWAQTSVEWPGGGSKDLQPITGDWDGNGKTDIGLRRVSTGKFYLWTRSGSGWAQTSIPWSSGAGADLQPITGDWDGNGKTDIGLRRVSTGKFYLLTGPTWTQTSVEWPGGGSKDLQPITGDWDGNGKTDIGLRRVSTGKFYLWTRSGSGWAQTSIPWSSGAGADLQPITGDWNGNGKTDIGLRRVSTGKFYLLTGPTWTQTSVGWSTGAG